VLVETLLEHRGPVGADRDDLITDLAQFCFDCVQLAELLVAVWSPAAAIVDKDGRLFCQDIS
jgi:hypothetical protein